MLATIGYQVHSIVIVKHGNHSYGLVEQVGVDSSAAIPAFNRPRLSEFSDMVSRPLFSPSRRFTEKEDVEKVVKSKSSRQPASTPAVDGAELDRFRLAGLVVGDDHTIAVIRDIAGNPFATVSYSDYGDRHFNRGYWGGSYRGGWSRPRHLEPSVEIDGYVRDETLPLRKLLDIGPEDRGRRLEKVVVRVSKVRGKTRISLVGDGRVYDSVKMRHAGRVVLKPSRDVVVGRDFNRLWLRIDGKAHIQRIHAELDRFRGRYFVDRGPTPLRCRDIVGHVGYSNAMYGTIALDRIVNLGGSRGCRIQSVEFKAASDFGGGHSALVVDGRVVSHQGPIGRHGEWIGFDFEDCPIYGRDVRNLSLKFLGRVHVESARVRFVR